MYKNIATRITAADSSMQKGIYDEASLHYSAVLDDLDNLLPDLHIRLAESLVRERRFSDARNTIDRLLKYYPNHQGGLNFIDIIASEEAKKFCVKIKNTKNPQRPPIFHLNKSVHDTIIKGKDLASFQLLGWARNLKEHDVSILVDNGCITSYPLNANRPDVVKFFIDKHGIKKESISHLCGFKHTIDLGGNKNIRIGLSINGKADWYHEIDIQPVRQVIEGKDGWLFLTNHADSTVKQHTGEILLNDSTITTWKNFSRNFNKKKNALYVISNSKEKVFPELYPYPQGKITITEQVEEIFRDFGVNYINPVEKCRNDRNSYYRTDTHWSDLGAFICFKECMHRLGYQHDYDQYFSFFEREVYGDLGSKLYPPAKDPKKTLKMIGLLRSRLAFNNQIPGAGNVRVFTNPNPMFDKNILMFGGSSLSAGNFSKFFSLFFSRVVAINLPGSYVQEIADHEQADHVIVQTNERYLIQPGRVYENLSEAKPLAASSKLEGQEKSRILRELRKTAGFGFYKKIIMG
uniref:alginate O-acetyltransferase AlgX-related protein n=1 Tax=Halomonas sp. TaxID=1486246 RepID=UPI002601C445|nr:hypothetical protein [Halomonas sp.]